MTANLEQATQLYRLHQYAQAIKEAERVLTAEPNNAQAYGIKALSYMATTRPKLALESASQAIALDPSNAHNHYVFGLVHLNLTKDLRKAENALKEALRLNSFDADYFEVLAQIKMVDGKFPEALALVEQGLKNDPENNDCLSTRAKILTKMGRREEAVRDLDRAIARDPENPQTLASAGWVKLEIGDHRGALEAFRDALRIKPNFEYARNGLLQALKSKNGLFRWYMSYSFWLDRLGSQARWMFLLGVPILVRLLRNIPELLPLIILYVVFAISTWLIDPLQNLVLRFDKYGRYVLSTFESMIANLVALAIVSAISLAIAGALTGLTSLYIGAAAIFLMIIPLHGLAAYHDDKPKTYKTALVATIALAAALALGFILLPFGGAASLTVFVVVALAEMLFSRVLVFAR